MRNLIDTLTGWIPPSAPSPAQEPAPGHRAQGSFRMQAGGSVELAARPRPSAESSSRLDARRAPLYSLPPAEVLRADLGSWDFIPRRSPPSSGSESPGSEASTQAFLTPASSMRMIANASVGSVSGRVEAPVVPALPGPQPLPVSRLAALRDALAGALERIPFSATALQDEPAQRALQDRYLDRAAQIAERREKAFGTTQPYGVGASMVTQTKEGLVTAVYESVQSFVTSAFRSPSGGAAGLSVAENKEFFAIDSALTTAVVQGALAYAAEGAMGAVNNRVTLSNMPKIARNNFEGLFYEQGVQANTVLLEVRNGAKEFMCADDPKAPAAASLAEQASRQLSAIKLRQDLLEGKSFSVIASPLLSGGFNTLRRYVSSPATLRSPAPVFLTSALASGAASGVTKLALEIGKTRAQVRMDDLGGGQQDLNLFRLSRPDPGAEPVRWTDMRGLPRVLAESAWESLALASEAARTLGHSAADMTYRYMLVNGIANVSGIGAGGMVGQLFRKGRHFGALPGESPHSRGSIAAQMTQSTFGDLIWRVLKDGMKGREGDANASLGRRRASRMGEQLQQAQREQGNLRTLVASLPVDSALWVAGPLTALAEGVGDIESHGNLRNRLQQQEPMDLQALQGLQRQLAALDLPEADDVARTDRDALVRQLGQVIQPLRSHADTQQWLRPRE
jgi:hypothetical protein